MEKKNIQDKRTNFEQYKATTAMPPISAAKKEVSGHRSLLDEYRDRLDIPIPADNDIKFAISGDPHNITDEQFEEVKSFARYVVDHYHKKDETER